MKNMSLPGLTRQSIAITTLFLICTLFVSCNNFMNGTDLKNQLDKEIDYENAPSYSVLVYADEETGSFVQGGGNHRLKATDSFTLEFQPKSSYCFICFQAVNRSDNSVSLSSYVKFSDETATSTTVTLLRGADDILIKPYCLPYLTITDFAPASKDSGVSFNSDIKVVFSSYVDESNFSYSDDELYLLGSEKSYTAESFDGIEYTYAYEKNSEIYYKNIEISSPSITGTITHYFNAPKIISGKTLLLTLKDEYYSTLKNAVSKDVIELDVTIGSDIYDNHGVTFADGYSVLSYSYYINTEVVSSSPSVELLFVCDSDSGTINPQGSVEIYTGLSYSLDFTASSAYYFKYWNVFYSSNGDELPYGNQIVSFSDQNSSSTTFVLNSNISGMVIKPVCYERPVIESYSFDSTTQAITIVFSNEMSLDSLRWSYSDISNLPIKSLLRDDEGKIYGYVSSSNEYVWKNIEIYDSNAKNILYKYKNPVYDEKTLMITRSDVNEVLSGPITVWISKNICDAAQTPAGNEGDYFELSIN